MIGLQSLEQYTTAFVKVMEWIEFNDEFMARSLLFFSDKGKIKLQNELRDSIETVPEDRATAAHKKKKK